MRSSSCARRVDFGAYRHSPYVVVYLEDTPGGKKMVDLVVEYFATWNDDPRPYVWTKPADQILESIARYCKRIDQSGH